MKASANQSEERRRGRTPWYRILYVQVLLAVALGIVIGSVDPEFATSLKPLGDAFIKLVKMMIGPIIFCTIVHGIASMRDLRELGRIGIKTLVYFEIVSTFALIIGLIVVNVLKPGAGFDVDPRALDPSLGQSYVQKAHETGVVAFLLHIIPNTLFEAFATGDLLQVLLVSVLAGLCLEARACASPCCTALPWLRTSSSASCASSCDSHRSGRSARWRSPSAVTGSAR